MRGGLMGKHLPAPASLLTWPLRKDLNESNAGGGVKVRMNARTKTLMIYLTLMWALETQSALIKL